jgi:hypothetical protein
VTRFIEAEVPATLIVTKGGRKPQELKIIGKLDQLVGYIGGETTGKEVMSKN